MIKCIVLIFILLMNLNASEKKSKKEIFKCQGKKTCKQMTSCKEAIFYLKECGVKRLDRDKDGIPCEALCR